MKKLIKIILKRIIPLRMRRILQYYRANRHKYSFSELLRLKVWYIPIRKEQDSARLFARLIKAAEVNCSHGYLYTYDPSVVRLIPDDITQLASITPDYSIILHSNLQEISTKFMPSVQRAEFIKSMDIVIAALQDKVKAITRKHYAEQRYTQMANLLPDLLMRDCNTLDEAIQKLLFYNGLFWQMRHKHNGLGRLDLILEPYYLKDVRTGILDYTKAKQMLEDMCKILGGQTVYKSSFLQGDTGQYILLGGIDQKGNTVDNELTRMFLEIFAEQKMPDPKLILRVNKDTPTETWIRSAQCLFTGCGSPLLMNEEVIMRNMVSFGYDEEDVWNVGTSACWEPLIIGKSSDQNNPFVSIVACDALQQVLEKGVEYDNFDDLFRDVKAALEILAPQVVVDKNYDYAPLMSLFTPECWERQLDFSHGGTKYMFQGTQLLSLPNLVNSLLNIKEYVFEKKLITLNDCRQVMNGNYAGREDLRQLFMNSGQLKFGSTNVVVLKLTDELIQTVSDSLRGVKANGHPVKFGLSSPNYIALAQGRKASLDVRKSGEPYAVHISPISSTIDLNEVLKFSEEIHYPDNCLNGNVVDFILPSAYQKHPDKLVSILRTAISEGTFEIQLNVLDKATLVDAKAHPEKYPNLVVRVWGFSAYFNDLPEEYKDNLIARAETYERA